MRVRKRLTYANVMSTLAVFLVVAGGGAYAAFKLKPNSVKSKHIAPGAVKGADAAEATFGKVPSAGSADTAISANIANGVAPDSIGPGEIQNPVRSISLPATSFINTTTNAFMDFSSGADSSPDFDTSFPQLAILFDAAGGANTDTDLVETNFIIPEDFASTGQVRLVLLRFGDTPAVTERLRCAATVSGAMGAFDNLTLTNTALPSGLFFSVLLAPVPATSYQPRAAASITCGIDDGAGGNTANDAVYLYGAQFRYTATQ